MLNAPYSINGCAGGVPGGKLLADCADVGPGTGAGEGGGLGGGIAEVGEGLR